VKLQVSPTWGSPSSPKLQSISPLSGAVSGGQPVNYTNIEFKCVIGFKHFNTLSTSALKIY